MSEDFPTLAGFRAGSLVAGYRLEAEVGAGGFAVVFRARDERLGRLVALKILAPALAMDAAFRRRFIAESRAAAAVDDAHIIPVHEAGEASGVLFIAMRFVMGGDLRRVLEREGALPPERAAEFISPVASALDAAHAVGLVHRDVKPANILVDARPGRPDHVYLSDFGVSKGAVSSVSLTGTGQFLGTPAYSAPEQIEGRVVDGRTDQYALACVAYHMLTGEAPFERDQGMAVLLAHLSAPPPSLRSRRPDLPEAADLVLARAMAKAPEVRYRSCGEFADAFREALGLAPYHSRSPAGPDHPPTQTVASPPECSEPAAAPTGTAAVPADPVSAASPSAAATMIPPVDETAPPPTHSARDRTGAGPDSGRTAPPGDGNQHTTPPVRDDHLRVVTDRPAPTPSETAPRAPRPHRGRAIRRRPVIITATALGIAVVGLVYAIISVSGAPVRSTNANGSSPASSHSARTSPATPARSFAVSRGPRLTDPGSVGVASVSFSPDGKELFTSDGYLWNLSSLAYTRLPGSATFAWASFSPSGKTLAAVGFPSAAATVWDAKTHAVAATLYDTDNTYSLTAAYSSDGTTLAVGADSGRVYVWDVRRHALITTLPLRGRPSVQSLAFSPDGKELLVAEANHTYVWNLASHAVVATLPGGVFAPILFSPDGKTLAIGNELWNASTYTRIATMPTGVCGSKFGIAGIAFSPDSSYLVAATGGRTCVWDVAARRLVATIKDPGGAGAFSVAFSRRGGMLATGDDNGSIYLWHIK